MPIKTKEHPLYDIRACPYCNKTIICFEPCLKNFTDHVLECEHIPRSKRHKPDEDVQACWVCGKQMTSFISRSKFLAHIRSHKKKRPSADGWYEKLADDGMQRDCGHEEIEIRTRLAEKEEKEDGTVYKTVSDRCTREWYTCPDKSRCKWKLRTSASDAKKKIKNHWISKHLKLCPHCGRQNPYFNTDVGWGSGFAAHVLNCHRDSIIRKYNQDRADT